MAAHVIFRKNGEPTAVVEYPDLEVASAHLEALVGGRATVSFEWDSVIPHDDDSHAPLPAGIEVTAVMEPVASWTVSDN